MNKSLDVSHWYGDYQTPAAWRHDIGRSLHIYGDMIAKAGQSAWTNDRVTNIWGLLLIG